MLRSLGWIPVLLCSLLATDRVSAQRAIQLDVVAEWPTHMGDAAAEVSEFIADYAVDLFWDYLKLQCEEGAAAAAPVASAAKLLPSNVQYLLETAVGLGTYAPAVRFFDAMSKDYGDPCNGEAFVVTFPGDAVHCADSPLTFSEEGRLDVSGDAPADWDHNYPTSNASRHVVLYGEIGSRSFCALHTHLADGAQRDGYRYSVRHSFAGAEELSSTRTLQGYGVHLDIKNMEYKNIDDSKDEKDAEGAVGGSALPDHEVKGVNFRRLHERYPDLGEELAQDHETFYRLEQEELRRGGGGSSADTMKAWKIADLGYQSVLSIITSEDPAWRMEQLLHNFPSQANSLTALRVGSEAKQVLSDLHTNGLANTLPFNSILVNGRVMDLTDATFGVYDLLDVIKEEYRKQGALNNLSLTSDVKRALAAAAVKVSAAMATSGKAGSPQGAPPDMATITRVDVSKGGRNVVQFVNNLEKDAMYMQNTFSRSVKTLLQPAWSLHMVAKNLYTVVAVVDLTTPEGRSLLTTLQGLYERQYPLRLGIVFASEEKDDAAMSNRNEGMPATPSDILRLFAHLKAQDDLATSIEFAFYLSSAMQDQFIQSYTRGADGEYILSADGSLVRNPAFTGKPQQQITRQALVDISARYLSEMGAAEDVEDELFDVLMGRKRHAHGGVDLVAETREYLGQRGLPMNSFSFNGIVVESVDLESQLMSLLGREQYFLGTMVQKGLITDRTRSIFNVVLKNSDVHARYHYILNEEVPVYASPLQTSLQSLVGGSTYINNRSSTPSSCVDGDAALAGIAADTVLVLFPVTRGGVLSAISSMHWAVGNYSLAPRGTRLALVPLLSSDPSPTELLIEPAISALVELVNLASNERDRVAAVELISYFLKTVQANPKEGVTPGAISIFRLMVTEGSKFEEPLTPELASKFDEVLVQLTSLEAQSGAADRHTMALSLVRSVEASIRAAREEEGTEADDACAMGDLSACNKGTYILFNGRVMKAKEDSPVHLLDLGMLSSLQSSVTNPVLAVLAENNILMRHSVYDIFLSEKGCDEIQSAADDLFLTMASFCGSNAVGGPNRVDVKGILTEAGMYRKSVTGVSRHFPHLAADPAAYVAPAQLFSAELTPPSSGSDSEEESVFITIVVNPLTQAGQRAAAMVRLCRDHLQLPVHLVLIPPFEVSEFPIKNYYRFVASPELSSEAVSGDSMVKALASFRQMPRTQIFTVRMDVPEAWNVQATYSPQDIDNLACDARSCGDTASSDTSYVTYTLKNLLVAGQCYERLPENDGMSPPNGLQLTLDVVKKDNVNLFPVNNPETGLVSSVRNSRVHSDTLVMQNLGYFQLQADAGMYFLRLAEGKAQYLFTMEKETVLFGATPNTSGLVAGDGEAAAGPGAPVGMQVAVKSFAESVLQLKVRKRPGMEKIPLLEDPDHKPSKSIRHKKNKDKKGEDSDGVVDTMWNSISSMFGGQPKAAADNETIHVFSLATGHVYERLLRIMMLSVSKRTKSPLKFWLFENFLSPTFKLLADEMSRKYGFEIGYVTYKWPKWLTEQTNKQRIIWGYKILFLDVLFPLNVKKVIYVDADQTVRADLKELWDMDLQGKPYGYVPFCTSRKETLGYQFWRSGYWESHLAGKPYHISALYVVDLTVFRRYAVGDRLRAVYDQLARDPNSLANLDQDLPNFAQHTVPIHSLPQEWLWCETWCSDKSKSKAKTIDLCNNPDKKEPKLDMARRIINGSLFKESWVELDEEIRALEVATGVKGRAE